MSYHMGSDEQWEDIGRIDAYYGVYTDEMFRKDNLSDDALAVFFESGRDYVREMIDIIRARLDPLFFPKIALDYGCGVGRVTIPLSNYCGKVIGLDVSDSMIMEAKENCAKFHVVNVEFAKADDWLNHLQAKVDFVMCCYVLQHVSRKRGMAILENLLERLTDDGIGCVQFPYLKEGGRFRELVKPIVVPVLYRSRVALKVLNVLMGRPSSSPIMEMNYYDLGEIFRLLWANGIGSAVVMTARTGECHSATVLLKKCPELHVGTVNLRTRSMH